MITSLPRPSVVQSLADTMVTVQARGTLEVVSHVAVVVLAVAVAAAFLTLLLFLRRLARIEQKVGNAAARTMARAGPLMDRGGDIADNLEFITRALRTDVERLNASVRSLADRLNQASDRMEERIEEFNALMEVVQSEAEAIFVDTASTVRGVREGARTLGAGDGTEPSGPPGSARRGRESAPPTGRSRTGELDPSGASGESDADADHPRDRRQEADHAPS